MNSKFNSIYYTSGEGPDECALAVFHVTNLLIKEAKDARLDVNLLEALPGNKSGSYISSLVSIAGHGAEKFRENWEGSVQWICKSPYRPFHKRKNWFVGVDVLMPVEDEVAFDDKEFKFDSMKASGPGGQHVNKTNSAVRVKHLPTGFVAIAQEERSQHMNKKLALARVVLLLENNNQKKKIKKLQEKWEKHKLLERGNPVRVFLGEKFKERMR
jgi:peptide chain release factor